MEKGWLYRILLGVVVVITYIFIKNYEDILKTKFSLGEMSLHENLIFIGLILFLALLIGLIVITIKKLIQKNYSVESSIIDSSPY
jgi:hypothetical protein